MQRHNLLSTKQAWAFRAGGAGGHLDGECEVGRAGAEARLRQLQHPGFRAGGAGGGTLTANVRLDELALKRGSDSSSTQVLGRWVPLRVACRT